MPAGGLGKRVGGPLPKQLVEVGGRPIYRYSLDTFLAHSGIGEVVLVVPADWFSHFEEKLEFDLKQYPNRLRLVVGGAERWQSVRKGVEVLGKDSTHVLVHDVARPFLGIALLNAVLAALPGGPCLVAKPVNDTVKVVKDGVVQSTLDRTTLWLAQTPQACAVKLLQELYMRMDKDFATAAMSWHPTDEASILEHYGIAVRVVCGDSNNDKVTTAQDLQHLSGRNYFLEKQD